MRTGVFEVSPGFEILPNKTSNLLKVEDSFTPLFFPGGGVELEMIGFDPEPLLSRENRLRRTERHQEGKVQFPTGSRH